MFKNLKFMTLAAGTFMLLSSLAHAEAIIRNPGEATGQLIFLTTKDMEGEGSAKYKALNAMSIPVFAEQPHQLTLVAGTITLDEQNINSHVQLKAIARKTPNLDLSKEPGGVNGETLKNFKDGDWVQMALVKGQAPKISKATKKDAESALAARKAKLKPVTLKADLSVKQIFTHEQLRSKDLDKVGAKAANYAELVNAMNTASRTVIRPGYAIPFYFYQQFLDENPDIKAELFDPNTGIYNDPMMDEAENTAYRVERLTKVQEMIRGPSKVDDALVDQLIALFDKERGPDGLPRKMKLRSSTNSEDLPDFNGAGLYDSYAYKPVKKASKKKGREKPEEKSQDAKRESLKETLRWLWSSIFNQRAWEERTAFGIPHDQVKMGVEVNPSFSNEELDGVVITKNVARHTEIKDPGVYIEAQRGDKYGVANPEAGVKPEQILVTIDANDPLNASKYKIHRLQKSNIADDNSTIMPADNPKDVMLDAEVIDLVQLVKKAEAHFKPIMGKDKEDFALDLEFKVDKEDSGRRQVYLKQARPYID
jgi:hypothetical protein